VTAPSATIKMRINIAGYFGRAVSVFAAYSPVTDILLVAQEQAYEVAERPGFLHITNQVRDEHHDAVFTEDSLREAINAYFELTALNLLNFSAKVQRLQPDSKIERMGVDERGMNYRIAPDINSGQVAVMVACLYASRQRAVGAAEDMADAFLALTI